MQELFQHETRREAPPLSKEGEIRSGNKADLLHCLKHDREFSTTEPISLSNVLEGSVLVNMLKPNSSKTLTDYAEDIFSGALRKEITKFDWIGISFDTYKNNSLKAATRKKRGKGIRRKVENNWQPPKYWHAFLRIDKTNLNHSVFLQMPSLRGFSMKTNLLYALLVKQ